MRHDAALERALRSHLDQAAEKRSRFFARTGYDGLTLLTEVLHRMIPLVFAVTAWGFLAVAASWRRYPFPEPMALLAAVLTLGAVLWAGGSSLSRREWSVPSFAHNPKFIGLLPLLNEPTVDPIRLSEKLELDPIAVMGLLDVARRLRLGRFIARVLDDSGAEIGRFPSARDVPDRISAEGREVTVRPEDIDIAFEVGRFMRVR